MSIPLSSPVASGRERPRGPGSTAVVAPGELQHPPFLPDPGLNDLHAVPVLLAESNAPAGSRPSSVTESDRGAVAEPVDPTDVALGVCGGIGDQQCTMKAERDAELGRRASHPNRHHHGPSRPILNKRPARSSHSVRRYCLSSTPFLVIR